jgi:hypothetical protein
LVSSSGSVQGNTQMELHLSHPNLHAKTEYVPSPHGDERLMSGTIYLGRCRPAQRGLTWLRFMRTPDGTGRYMCVVCCVVLCGAVCVCVCRKTTHHTPSPTHTHTHTRTLLLSPAAATYAERIRPPLEKPATASGTLNPLSRVLFILRSLYLCAIGPMPNI